MLTWTWNSDVPICPSDGTYAPQFARQCNNVSIQQLKFVHKQIWRFTPVCWFDPVFKLFLFMTDLLDQLHDISLGVSYWFHRNHFNVFIPRKCYPIRVNSHLILSYVILYHIISYHMISYHIISNYIKLHHVISYYIISNDIIWYYIILYQIISYYIILYHIISYHIISYHMISYDIIIWFYIILYLIV